MRRTSAGWVGRTAANPVACAAAVAALDAFEHGGLIEKAQRIGEIAYARLGQAADADPRIGEIRGRGAMIAIELIDPATGAPDPGLTGRIAAACHAAGVIVLTCGTYGNVIRLLPPLVIPEDLFVDGLDVIIESLAAA